MRRQTKYRLVAAVITGGIVALADIFLQWLEHRQKGLQLNWDSYDGKRTLKSSLLGAVSGGVLGSLYYDSRLRQESRQPFNSDRYINKILTSVHVKSNPLAFRRAVSYRERVKWRLAKRFGYKLVAMPEDTGSFHKRTAVGSNYDLDVILPFRRGSYKTLEQMYNDVYETVEQEFGSEALITKQSKTIGITFGNEDNPLHFDIVPGREINNYPRRRDLNLYVRPEWTWQDGSSFKTNVLIQKTFTACRPEARKVIKLLKVYRDRNGLAIPTIVIEQCVVEALSMRSLAVRLSTSENLINCMRYIARKIEQKELIDPSNSNNNLHDKIDDVERSNISDQLHNDIARIEENPRYLIEIMEC